MPHIRQYKTLCISKVLGKGICGTCLPVCGLPPLRQLMLLVSIFFMVQYLVFTIILYLVMRTFFSYSCAKRSIQSSQICIKRSGNDKNYSLFVHEFLNKTVSRVKRSELDKDVATGQW